MNFLSVFSGPYGLLLKYGLMAAFVAAALGFVYSKGFKAATANCEAAKVEAVQRAVEQAQEIAKQDAEIVRNNVQTVEVIRERTRTIRIKEKNHATANPLPPECVLDDTRMRNINDALSGKNTDSGKPDYRLPAASKIGK